MTPVELSKKCKYPALDRKPQSLWHEWTGFGGSEELDNVVKEKFLQIIERYGVGIVECVCFDVTAITFGSYDLLDNYDLLTLLLSIGHSILYVLNVSRSERYSKKYYHTFIKIMLLILLRFQLTSIQCSWITSILVLLQ